MDLTRLWKCCFPSSLRQLPAVTYPPLPPTCRKEKIFSELDYCEQDNKIAKDPGSWNMENAKLDTKTQSILLNGIYEAFAKRLTSSCRTDLARVRAIFHWMTSLDDYSYIERFFREQLDTLDENDDDAHFQKGYHAIIFARLARAADLACVVITGVVKNFCYVVGERGFRRKPETRGQWNAVLVDGEWRLLDVLWASCAHVRRRAAGWPLVDVHGETFKDEDVGEQEGEEYTQANEFFFLTDPDMFIYTHLPDDPVWQLLPEMLRFNSVQFEKCVYLRERFFTMQLSMQEDSKRHCVVETDKGEVTIKFRISKDVAKFAQFRYMLFKKHNEGVDSDDNSESTFNWKGCIFYQLSKEQISFICNMPSIGTYRMDIFGRHTVHDKDMDLVCTYIIKCDSVSDRQFPDNPDIGWGPGRELEEAELSAHSHEEAVVEIDKHILEIRFRKTSVKEMVFWHCLKHNSLREAELQSCATLRVSNDDVIVVLRLPEPGMYAYKMYADFSAAKGDIPNVCNYLIMYRRNEGDQTTLFPPLRWGLLGPGIQARHLGIVSVDRDVTIGTINAKSSVVDLIFDIPVPEYNILYEMGMLRPDGVHHNCAAVVKMQGKTAKIRLTLGGSGEYAFNLFVRRKETDFRIYHVHSLLIGYSDEDQQEEGDNERDGGHPSVAVDAQQHEAFSVKAGLHMMFGPTKETPQTPHTPEQPRDVCEPEQTYKDYIDLKVSGAEFLFTTEIKAAQYPPDDISMKLKKDGLLKVGLPLEGEYVVDIFELLNDTGDQRRRLRNVHRYHITRIVQPESEASLVTPLDIVVVPRHERNESEIREREIRRLENAMDSENIEALSEAIDQFKKAGVTGGEDLCKKAERRLAFLELSRDLMEGIRTKDRHLLLHGVSRAKRVDLIKELGQLYHEAAQMYIILNQFENIKREVMKLDNKAIAEMKSYANPTNAIIDVTKAMLIVLGEPDESVEEWKQIARFLGISGRMGLKLRISDFDVESLHVETACQAMQILRQHSIVSIDAISKVASSFFCWTIGMIREAKTRHVQAGGVLAQGWANMDDGLALNDEFDFGNKYEEKRRA